MSEPMEFCSEMECSGVRSLFHQHTSKLGHESRTNAYMGEPSWGLRKRTPSSVTCASFNSDTIWKLCIVRSLFASWPWE